jgi:hypothetical protein
MSISGARINMLIVFLISKLPTEYITITDTPSIMNANTLKLALRTTGGIFFAIKYAAIGGPPIPVAPFAIPENIPTINDRDFVFLPLYVHPLNNKQADINTKVEIIIRRVSELATTKTQAPMGIAIKAPIRRGMIGFHFACCAAFGNTGIITNTSIDNARKTASLGGINKFNSGTITKVVPKPENPRINPPVATIASKQAQCKKSKLSRISVKWLTYHCMATAFSEL